MNIRVNIRIRKIISRRTSKTYTRKYNVRVPVNLPLHVELSMSLSIHKSIIIRIGIRRCGAQRWQPFVKNGPTPASFYHIFSVFSSKHHYNFIQQIYVKKCPSRILCWDSNPRPSEHDSPPITTRPGQSFYQNNCFTRLHERSTPLFYPFFLLTKMHAQRVAHQLSWRHHFHKNVLTSFPCGKLISWLLPRAIAH